MFQRFHAMREEREGGFTLIELLVVVLIIAILAAIAIPVFLRQREKAYIADVQSTLKNTATAAESWGTAQATPGDYSAITWAKLQTDEDAKAPTTQTVTVTGTKTSYCIKVVETRLSGHEWGTATYSSLKGRPLPDDDCTTTTTTTP